MTDDITPLTRDPELARQLSALHAPPSSETVAALRQRIRLAAVPQLQARADAARGVLVLRRPTWLDVTSGFARVAIPLSLAAALFAMLILRALPQVTSGEDTNTMAMATSVVSDSLSAPEITDELLMPADADAVLLAPFDGGARQ